MAELWALNGTNKPCLELKAPSCYRSALPTNLNRQATLGAGLVVSKLVRFR